MQPVVAVRDLVAVVWSNLGSEVWSVLRMLPASFWAYRLVVPSTSGRSHLFSAVAGVLPVVEEVAPAVVLVVEVLPRLEVAVANRGPKRKRIHRAPRYHGDRQRIHRAPRSNCSLAACGTCTRPSPLRGTNRHRGRTNRGGRGMPRLVQPQLGCY